MYELLPNIPTQLQGILSDLKYFVPEIYLAAVFVVVLLADLFIGKIYPTVCKALALMGIAAVAIQVLGQLVEIKDSFFMFGDMLLQSRTSLLFRLIIDLSAFALILHFNWDKKLKLHAKGLGDLYSITIASIFGLHLMTMASNLLSVYLAVEMVSIASYLLVAYRSENAFSAEAGLKYVLFGAAASAIMLYGISLLYGAGGSLSLFDPAFVNGLSKANAVAVSFAMVLVLVGIAFKLSFVPAHFWVPDVYQGALTPITAWLSTVPKIAAFGLLINFLTPFIFSPAWRSFDFKLALSVIGIATMIAGNFAAVMQTNAKRMLAYSSVGHTGFALMAIVTFSDEGIKTLVFYLAVYAVANIAALALVSYFTYITNSDDIKTYEGLGYKYPAASICFVIILISLTGLPVTAGFNAKLLVFSSVYGVYQQNHDIFLLLLTTTGAITTVVSLFYYIKIPLHLFLRRSPLIDSPVAPFNLLVLVIIASAALVFFGIFPSVIINLL
ncbi:NADH-quinone oxidoreductase subunit N [Mucilaginibacter auburnensis]|uniref:NADH-quinone oxidoreductase subunit N n=1 Tax=Mucilaginibacter auburnensis TaxID=1457233 RepID=A0A2H9VUK6_9SPHI|nr:NADH-quinone oxidoreductase subunit N [Mucilaginibacter auburnensis]PJJ84481.1 NADH-quinone oxidoreductase subunit N [Mucilaginibacter auburnensis]